MERYTKPPLTYQQQVELLKSRGLQFADEARAKRHLANISYYRMSAYMLPFKEANQEGEILDSFKKDITWDCVYTRTFLRSAFWANTAPQQNMNAAIHIIDFRIRFILSIAF